MSDNLIGNKLGPYEIRSLLGQGGMSTVYLAYQPTMDRMVAVKVLPPEFLHDSTFLARFQNEARTVAKLEHINILPVYDVGEDRGIPYIVSRYLPGGTVADLLAQHLPSNEVISRILDQVAAALDYAHARGIIHRDLKPSNVLLDSHGNAYLGDFGISRMLNSDSPSNLTGSRVVGTPSYVAPEQVKKGDPVTHAADIYALGILVYEMLTGEPPYRDPDATKTLMAHVLEPVPSARDIDPNVPPEVDAVVQKALAKRPDDRYPSAGAFAEAFRYAVERTSAAAAPQPSVHDTEPRPFTPAPPRSAPPAAIPPRPGTRTPTPAPDDYEYVYEYETPKRSGCGFPVLLIVPLVLIMLLGGVAVVAYALTDGDPGSLFVLFEAPPTNTPWPTVTATGDSGAVVTPEGPTERAPILPAPSGGDRLVFTSNRTGNYDVFIIDIDGSNARQLTDSAGPDFDPHWSPDGNQIVYAAREEQTGTADLWIMDADGGNKHRVTETKDADETDPDWSPDGQWIAFCSNRDGDFDLYVMRPDGSEVRQITFTAEDELTPRWSPDGALLGYYGGDYNVTATSELYIISPEPDSVPNRITSNEGPDLWLDWAPTGLLVAFTSGRDLPEGQRAIFTLNVPTGDIQQITDGQVHDDDPSWSPDGTRIAFDSSRDGDGVYDLFIAVLDGNLKLANLIQITNSSGDNVAPDWQPRR